MTAPLLSAIGGRVPAVLVKDVLAVSLRCEGQCRKARTALGLYAKSRAREGLVRFRVQLYELCPRCPVVRGQGKGLALLEHAAERSKGTPSLAV